VPTSTTTPSLSVASLFAGIGGIESGLHAAGHRTELLCEVWEPAQAVLAERFPDVPLHGDVRDLEALPRVDVVTAGFPCTDLSQAGRTAGITGKQSGLVGEVFRLLRQAEPRWLLLENVRNMLPLDGGKAMRYLVDELEALGYRWAYRVVDSRFTGVPQRRHRVLLLASRTDDPRDVLLVDEAGEPPVERYRDDAYGFYWTEGLRGLGWARDATPPLKGGSTIGIPSPPAVWLPSEEPGRKLVTPAIDHAEQLQGFPAGWTEAAGGNGNGRGHRWKLVGNAVTAGVAKWVGDRLAEPGSYDASSDQRLAPGSRWPNAAWGGNGKAFVAEASFWPRLDPCQHLRDIAVPAQCKALSHRGAAGFLDRASRGQLRFVEEFMLDVKEHVEVTAP
jgi:DNA (cytosine-5)-methyltransferase 1